MTSTKRRPGGRVGAARRLRLDSVQAHPLNWRSVGFARRLLCHRIGGLRGVVILQHPDFALREGN